MTTTHHDQAVMLTGYARHYDQLADAIDRAAVIADSSRLVSSNLRASVSEGRSHLEEPARDILDSMGY